MKVAVAMVLWVLAGVCWGAALFGAYLVYAVSELFPNAFSTGVYAAIACGFVVAVLLTVEALRVSRKADA